MRHVDSHSGSESSKSKTNNKRFHIANTKKSIQSENPNAVKQSKIDRNNKLEDSQSDVV
jgi:hypothetical protein